MVSDLLKPNSDNQKASNNLKIDAFFRNSIHLENSCPKVIFEERRPYESLTDHALNYRLSNYRNETSALFFKAIFDIQEVLKESEIAVKTESKVLNKWVVDFNKWVDFKNYNFYDYFFDYVLQKKLVDPNGVLFCLPVVENTTFNASENTFVELGNKKISIDLLHFDCTKILKHTEKEILINGGKWEYLEDGEKKYNDFYFRIVNTDLFILVPTKDGQKEIPYYKYPTLSMPIVSLGKILATKKDEKTNIECKYFISEFFGSLQIADKYLAVDSDLTVINSRSHPIKFQFKQNCTMVGCGYLPQFKRFGYLGINGDFEQCNKCGGTGEVNADTSPFTTIKIERKEGMNDEDISIKNPIGFASPPVDILNYNKTMANDLYLKLANSLCVNASQNMTNQSAEAKKYDISAKVTQISNICEDLIRVMSQSLFFVGAILDNKSISDVEITKPIKWDVKSNNDLLSELYDAKANNAPFFVLISILKKYLEKKYKNNKFKNEIVSTLIKKDKLLPYGVNDLGGARAVFGTDIEPIDIITHNFSSLIVEEIANDKMLNDSLDFSSEFDKRLQDYL